MIIIYFRIIFEIPLITYQYICKLPYVYTNIHYITQTTKNLTKVLMKGYSLSGRI